MTLKPLYNLGLRPKALECLGSEARFYSKAIEN
ncbi:MAG: hypothetical protein ACJA2E_001395 [Arenicella sp.]|jgi:hypothetical protein